MKSILFKLKLGEYISLIQEKGVNECCGQKDIQEGDIFYTIKIGDEEYYDVISHIDALKISYMVKIENMLKQLSKAASG